MGANDSKATMKSDIDNAKISEYSCGLIMPISALDGCGPEHWAEVKAIVTEAIESIPKPSFDVRLVSDADEVGVIQKRIVQNLYSAHVVVCDVSGKNPNVMFELGMRLAFDKPTVIIKDDKTEYSFDTGIIEHLTYPRDLRFSKMVSFKAVLVEKVLATHRAAQNDPQHSTFLKNFGTFNVAQLSQKEVSGEKLFAEFASELSVQMSRLRREVQQVTRSMDLRRYEPNFRNNPLLDAAESSQMLQFQAIVQSALSRRVNATKMPLDALLRDDDFLLEILSEARNVHLELPPDPRLAVEKALKRLGR